jgi:hypothetical protein
MSKLRSLICAAAALSTALAVPAAPVELDGDMWHAIVIRPVDLWVGDAAARDDSLDEVKSHKANYMVYVRGQQLRGGPLLFQGPSKDSIVAGVQDELEHNGFKLGLSQEYMFTVDGCEYMPAAQYKPFADYQARDYRELVRAEGDPDTLESRIRGRKFAGSLLALATIGIAGKVGGASIAEAVTGSTIPGDAYQVPLAAASESIPVLLPAFDASPYETVSVRRINYKGGMNGQILIALKKGWTEDDEAQALIKSITVALGVGATPESIEKSRGEDLAYRKSVWASCVTAGDCKPDIKAESLRDQP